MYQEGTYLMRKKNLLIRFECEVAPYQITLAFLEIEVPFLVPDPSTSRDFKGTVLTHKICYRKSRSRPQPNASFIPLARHIPDLCRALSIIRWRISLHNEHVKHIVTLTDPYAKQISGLSTLFGSVSVSELSFPPSEIESFLSRKQQEEPIAPYPAHLKAFPDLEFNGVIPKNLQTIATSEFTFMPEVYSYDQIEIFREHIEEMMNQGQIFLDEERYVKATRVWSKCQRLEFSQCSGKRGERLLESLSLDSLNRLAFLLFYAARWRVGITSYLMQTKWKGNHEKIVIEGKSMVKEVENFTSWLTDHKAKVTYPYDTDKIAKRFYNLSIIFRLSGQLAWASVPIDLALDENPNDSEFLIAEGKISLAISKEARRKLMNDNLLLR
ncbi:uncharacterized protein EAF01_011440 [Botrytis porri]|uniref:uncharacterized protein n=1 Tax=Botrytis porri TaxID=87229 RepID=UPI0019025779|nr:uncharacterized protein EAF01_011440 [Botrytis porri]KAF7885375.1 hypothetical protein EAF01_011440 [Botrytis porri]